MEPCATNNVGCWPRRHAEVAGERLALRDAERALPWRSLDERCERLVRVLAAAGIGRGDRVALVLGNRTVYLEAVFAAARLGAISVPLNARLAPPELARLFDDCRPAALLLDEAHAPRALQACAEAHSAPPFRLVAGGVPDAYERALAGAARDATIAAVSPDDPMMILYTSGTTGVPKGAVLPHRKTLFNALNAVQFFGLGRGDRVLVPLPLFHSFGLVILALPALYAGATVHLEPRFDPASVWQRVDELAITFFGAVPTMFQALLDELHRRGAERPDLSSLRFLFSAGAAIPVELIRAYEREGLLVKQGFGQTETSILCALDAADALRKAGSVGRPVFHAEIRLVDPATLDGPVAGWRDVAPGDTGEIVVRGPITMLGYWERPDATAETLRDGWVRTGDLAQRDAEGFYTLVGRARDLFISGGENVYPAEVEATYAAHPDLREIAVVGVPDAHWGEVGRAYVVLAPGRRLDTDALRAWGRARLAVFKVPASFVALPSLPRTVTGKVQKHRLGESGP
ncbi:MAG TPA: AMP-binding protein [Myxococcota bacterium]|jgi:fatty-acyl-CoA synthase|nr:AMP-binding protein [Myxococcota bacterium]